MVFIFYNSSQWEVVVCFVDIGGIVDQQEKNAHVYASFPQYVEF